MLYFVMTKFGKELNECHSKQKKKNAQIYIMTHRHKTVTVCLDIRNEEIGMGIKELEWITGNQNG